MQDPAQVSPAAAPEFVRIVTTIPKIFCRLFIQYISNSLCLCRLQIWTRSIVAVRSIVAERSGLLWVGQHYVSQRLRCRSRTVAHLRSQRLGLSHCSWNLLLGVLSRSRNLRLRYSATPLCSVHHFAAHITSRLEQGTCTRASISREQRQLRSAASASAAKQAKRK